MKNVTVLTIVGTRPEIIRLSRVLPALDEHYNHIIVHTGQNYDYELGHVFFEELNLRKPDFQLDSARNSHSAIKTISNILILVEEVLDKVRPDAVLILGDTNSGLSAIAAKKMKIPIFHMEAGNRCFDQRVPEETNRKIIDHIADINLCYSDIARNYLIAEGFPSEQVITTGSPMREVLDFYRKEINASKICKILNLQQDKFVVASIHREENIECDKKFNDLTKLINYIAEDLKLPVVMSTHPRTRSKIEKAKNFFSSNIQFLKPLGFFDYVSLQMNSKFVLSDSGTISEESSILNFPALNLRDAHERPESMEEGSVMMVGMDLQRVKTGINILSRQPRGNQRLLNLVSDYKDNNVSHKIVRIINSYINYVNNNVWKKF